MIGRVMDFPAIIQKVLIIPSFSIKKISVMLFKVNERLSNNLYLVVFFSKDLGWHKEKYILIGHSYGATFGTIVDGNFLFETCRRDVFLDVVCRKLYQGGALFDCN